MRDTTPNSSPARVRGVVAGAAAAALALTLVPGSTAAQAATGDSVEPSLRSGQVAVRLKVATDPAVDVAIARRVWPSRVLKAHDVDFDRNDLVKVFRDGRKVKGRAKRVRHGDRVRLVEVDKRRKVKRKRVRAGVVEVPTTKLAPGRRKVVRKRRPGVRKVVVARTFHNGDQVKRRVVSRKLVRKPRPKRVLVGRRPYSVAGADGLNWGALAQCESSGNPRAVNPAGYYGLYQFNVATWRSVGGSGMPHHASAGQQTYRAKLLYKSRGRSPWPTCGRLL